MKRKNTHIEITISFYHFLNDYNKERSMSNCVNELKVLNSIFDINECIHELLRILDSFKELTNQIASIQFLNSEDGRKILIIKNSDVTKSSEKDKIYEQIRKRHQFIINNN